MVGVCPPNAAAMVAYSKLSIEGWVVVWFVVGARVCERFLNIFRLLRFLAVE